MVTSFFSSLSPARSRDWPEALRWYSTALEKTDCDEGGEYDGMQDEPRYTLLAREAEMLSVGGFRLQKDPQRSGRSGRSAPEAGGPGRRDMIPVPPARHRLRAAPLSDAQALRSARLDPTGRWLRGASWSWCADGHFYFNGYISGARVLGCWGVFFYY